MGVFQIPFDPEQDLKNSLCNTKTVFPLSGPYAAVFIIRSGGLFSMFDRQEYKIRQTGP